MGRKVQLVEIVGKNLATGRQQRVPMYRILVNGRPVGFIGWKARCKALFTEKLGPLEVATIEREIGRIMNRTVSSRVVPEVPPELLNMPKGEDWRHDQEFEEDFDA